MSVLKIGCATGTQCGEDDHFGWRPLDRLYLVI